MQKAVVLSWQTGDKDVAGLDWLNRQLAEDWRVISATPMGVGGGIAGATQRLDTSGLGNAQFREAMVIASLVIIEKEAPAS